MNGAQPRTCRAGKIQLACKVKPSQTGSGIAMSESELDLNDMCYLIVLPWNLVRLLNGMQKLMPTRGI